MAEIVVPSIGMAEGRLIENLLARMDMQEATIEYMAMMADIELEEEEDAQGDVED